MSPGTVKSYEAVPLIRNLDRLDARFPMPDLKERLWKEVHEEFQAELECLEKRVLQETAGVRVEIGHTRGQKFFLFSYRTFSVANTVVDPMVVGIVFTPAQEGITVEADISGEQSGDGISTLPVKVVGESREELLGVARASARELCQLTAVVAAALTDPSRKVD